ncbi:MAG: hypothetical protein F4156_00335 [Holophagales bacterium]|nr:hypothetical protein [Holophagales bacterium]
MFGVLGCVKAPIESRGGRLGCSVTRAAGGLEGFASGVAESVPDPGSVGIIDGSQIVDCVASSGGS